MHQQTDHDRARIIEAHDARQQEAYWGGAPDDDAEIDLLRTRLAEARAELTAQALDLINARHVLRRVECLLRGEALRQESQVFASVADECAAVLMEE